jgi:hypothetical protein
MKDCLPAAACTAPHHFDKPLAAFSGKKVSHLDKATVK